MLRVLNEAEMEMVSGGTDNCVPIPDGVSCEEHSNPSITTEELAMMGMTIEEYLFGPEVYYNGNMYPNQGAADVARTNDRRLNNAYGNSTDPDSGLNPQDQVTFTSPVQPTDTGIKLGTVGGVDIGIDPNGGNPRLTGRIETQ